MKKIFSIFLLIVLFIGITPIANAYKQVTIIKKGGRNINGVIYYDYIYDRTSGEHRTIKCLNSGENPCPQPDNEAAQSIVSIVDNEVSGGSTSGGGTYENLTYEYYDAGIDEDGNPEYTLDINWPEE